MINPTLLLTRSGVVVYNKLTEWEKSRPLDYLRPHHFIDYGVFLEYEKQCRLAPFRDRIGSLTNPDALDNLCQILVEMQDKLYELESSKADREYDY
jgi:hypothetical protein